MPSISDVNKFRNRVPYQGVTSFWRTPYSRDLDDADIAVYGIPYDLGTTNRPGARFGPRAVREQSCFLGLEDEYWPHGYALKDRCQIVDYGDLSFLPGLTEDMLETVEEHVTNISKAGVSTLGIGGDHLVAYPEIKAHYKVHGTLALIHFDAHTDTYDLPYLNHGSMFCYATRERLIDPKLSFQIGIRTAIPPEPALNVITADKALKMGAEAIVDQIRNVIGDRKVFLSLDVDGMDPAFTPGTGTPVPGGLTSALQREILWGLKGLNIVGADVVEVSPPYDNSDITALAGAAVAMDLLYALFEARQSMGMISRAAPADTTAK